MGWILVITIWVYAIFQLLHLMHYALIDKQGIRDYGLVNQIRDAIISSSVPLVLILIALSATMIFLDPSEYAKFPLLGLISAIVVNRCLWILTPSLAKHLPLQFPEMEISHKQLGIKQRFFRWLYKQEWGRPLFEDPLPQPREIADPPVNTFVSASQRWKLN